MCYTRCCKSFKNTDMKKIDWCKILGHNWEAIYIKGRYSNIDVKFIACKCKRCDKGHDDALGAVNKQTVNEYNTYSEKYYD